MAHRVKAQIQQLVRRSEQPNRRAMEVRKTRPRPCCVDVEIEGAWVLHVVVQLEIERIAAPWPVVIVGVAVRRKSEPREQLLGASEIGPAHQKVEVVASA